MYLRPRKKAALLKYALVLLACAATLLFLRQSLLFPKLHPRTTPLIPPLDWHEVSFQHPFDSHTPLPTAAPKNVFPRIQYNFRSSHRDKVVLSKRRTAVKDTFLRAWRAYKEHAWLKDELAPLSKRGANSHGWATTMVDSLDTLWIMDLKDEFEEVVIALRKHVDFTRSDRSGTISVFETVIRHLGGLIGAYDVSEHRYPDLLDMATEMGEMLYHVFDTPNHMPVVSFNPNAVAGGQMLASPSRASIADLGTLSLEFTRLSQITGDPKYFGAVDRVMNELEKAQDNTLLPGMWSTSMNPSAFDFVNGNTFTLGRAADSGYEYIPKAFQLLRGADQKYATMWAKTISALREHVLYRPMTPNEEDILIPGVALSARGEIELDPNGEHLGCFAGGMVELAAKVFERPNDLVVGKQLVDGSVWVYRVMPTGIGPESWRNIPCPKTGDCPWNETLWLEKTGDKSDFFPKGMAQVDQRGYQLRPEAIESVFYGYRVTGDATYLETAWDMFAAIDRVTRTASANAHIKDVFSFDSAKEDKMESFWLAETLKYFYLIFSDPDFYSLDQWVFNTEAHPFKIPS